MNKKLKFFKVFTIIGMISVYSLLQNVIISAASFSVGATPGSVSPGQTFTVTISANGGGGFYVSGSNATVSSTNIACSMSCSVTATAGSAGTASVTVTAYDASTIDLEEITGSKTVSVSVKSPTNNKPNTPEKPTTPTPEKPNQETPKKEEPKEETKSKVSTLSSLTISEGTLSPAFKSGTMEYKVSLPASAKSIKVDAKASDAKATVKGTGNHDLKVGDNTITVTGVAENGSTSVYTLKVHVDETPTAFVQFNDQKLGVVSNIEAVKAPTGFEKSKVKMDGKDVDAWTNNATKMTIVYLVNDKQEKDFYVYDEAKGVTSIFRPMALLGNNLILVDVPKDVQTKEGMNFTTVKVDNMDLPGWTFNEKALENYVVIYMMDENGKMNYYQYEKTENRLQLYSGAASITQETYDAYVKEQEAKQDKLMIIIYCLSGLSGALLILAGVLFFRKKPNNKHQKIDVKEFDYGDSMHIEGNSMLDEEENE